MSGVRSYNYNKFKTYFAANFYLIYNLVIYDAIIKFYDCSPNLGFSTVYQYHYSDILMIQQIHIYTEFLE